MKKYWQIYAECKFSIDSIFQKRLSHSKEIKIKMKFIPLGSLWNPYGLHMQDDKLETSCVRIKLVKGKVTATVTCMVHDYCFIALLCHYLYAGQGISFHLSSLLLEYCTTDYDCQTTCIFVFQVTSRQRHDYILHTKLLCDPTEFRYCVLPPLWTSYFIVLLLQSTADQSKLLIWSLLAPITYSQTVAGAKDGKIE